MNDAFTAARAPARLLKVADVQHLLSISRGTVYKLVASGALKPVKIGRSVRFKEVDVEKIAG